MKNEVEVSVDPEAFERIRSGEMTVVGVIRFMRVVEVIDDQRTGRWMVFDKYHDHGPPIAACYARNSGVARIDLDQEK